MQTSCTIYGCSDGINKLKGLEKNLPDNTIGLNAFPLYYRTEYWIWMDNESFGNCVYKRKGNVYEPFFYFEPNFDPEKDLFGSFTVATFALDFAIKQGYQKATLYGILDGEYIESEKDYTHAGNLEISYKRFYYDPEEEYPLMSVATLQKWKAEILSYSDKIKIEIPNRTF
jgi:hypothetical protein